ncbi:MAG TPA: condensation domain-containing protein [Micromonospora sp.]
MSVSGERPSWTMRHQLDIARRERDAGLFNPHQVIYAARVSGRLDVDRLAAAWRRLQERHGVLRTRFDLADSSWLTTPGGFSELELTHLRTGTRDVAAAKEALGVALRRPFDLSRGPLCRLHAVPVDGSTTVLGFAVQHLVCDGWSLSVLTDELWRLYADPDTALPPVRTDFPAFVRAEYARLAADQGRADLRRQAELLLPVGPLPEIRLPGIRVPAGGVDHRDSATVSFTLDPPTVRQLRRAGSPYGLSVIGLMHAALAGTLHQLTGLPRIGVALGVANRADPALRHTVGWIAGSVVVLTEAGADPDDPAFLRDFTAGFATAIDHAHLPLAAVVNELEPHLVGMPSTHPWVSFNPTPPTVGRLFPAPQPPGLVLDEIPLSSGWHYKSLSIVTAETATGIRCAISYKTCWYDAAAVEALRNGTHRLLLRWAAGKPS